MTAATSVECPVCRHLNTPGSRFCSNCGNPLTGTARPPTPPGDPGHRPADEPPGQPPTHGREMRGERRIVTMLFADMQGSTAGAEGLDPEDWAEIVNGVFARMIEPVQRYEGTLARLQGDAILAFFGAPVAHEDDPVRAVRAGLEIVEGLAPYKAEVQERWGFPVEVRVGINTGLVVVGDVGSDLRMEYTALGDAINVAARMEQTADPGTVRITEETRRLIGDAFEVEDLGPVVVKGKSEPVPAVRVVRWLGEPVRDAAGVFVGRGAELDELSALVDRVREGEGWIASLVADGGVGKSRLLAELRERVAASAPLAEACGEEAPLGWLIAASRSYEGSIPYSTLRHLLERWWSLGGAEDGLGRIREAVAAVGAPDPDLPLYLAELAGIPVPADEGGRLLEGLEAPVLQQRITDAFRSYVVAEAARRPVVVVLEDLHWSDPMSLTLVEELMGAVEGSSLGLVLAMRPYRDEPTWRLHEVAAARHPQRHRAIHLEPLDPEAARRLAGSVLGSEASEEVVERIVGRADGNPLFVEEMARSLRESGRDGLDEVPATLEHLLTARLDRLPERSKAVAQIASVVGSRFDRETLAPLVGGDVGEAVSDLLARGILVEGRGPAGPFLGFRHALMQEAAYSTILHRTRRRLHRLVADHLVDRAPGAVQEIARHLVEAGEAEEAFPHLIAAGRQAARSMALADAIRFFTTALGNVPADADPALVVAAHDGLGEAHSLVPDLTNAAAAYQSLLEYGQRTGQASAQVTALNRLGYTTASIAADLVSARRYLEQARVLAEETGDELGLAEYHLNSCMVSTFSGELERAVVHDEETARLGERHGMERIRVTGLLRKAINLVWLTDFEAAGRAVEDTRQAAAAARDDEVLHLAESMGRGMLLVREGRLDEALGLMAAARDPLLKRASYYLPILQVRAGWLRGEAGDLAGSLRDLDEGLRLGEQGRQGFSIAAAAATTAWARSLAGLPSPEFRARAVETVQVPGGEYLASTVWTNLGLAQLQLGDPEAAADDLGRALSVSSITRFWERPRALAGRAIAVAADDPAEAHRLVDEAQAFVLDHDFGVYHPLVSFARGEVLREEGRTDEAGDLLAGAASSAAAMGLRSLLLRVETSRVALARRTGASTGEILASARSLVDAISRSVPDDALRAAFCDHWLPRVEEPEPSR